MQLVLDTRGLVIRQKNKCFHLSTTAHERLISPRKISSIAITTQVMISSAAIQLAVQNQIPIYFQDGFGQPESRVCSAAFGKLAQIRRKQVYFARSIDATRWAIRIFQAKIQSQIEVLSHLQTQCKLNPQIRMLHDSITILKAQAIKLEQYGDQPLHRIRDQLMGTEGIAARSYWQSVSECMPLLYQFKDRNRHPASDYFNAALNYLYGMLYSVVETALTGVGLDPHLGIIHADQYGKPTLSFDVIEPFRVYADRLLIDAVLAGQVAEDFFEQKPGVVRLAKKGKHFFIPAFNAYLRESTTIHTGVLPRKLHIYRASAELVQVLETFQLPD